MLGAGEQSRQRAAPGHPLPLSLVLQLCPVPRIAHSCRDPRQDERDKKADRGRIALSILFGLDTGGSGRPGPVVPWAQARTVPIRA